MDVEQTPVTETPQVETPASGPAEGAAPAASPEAPAVTEGGQGAAAPQPAAYQPNLTFKVRHEQKKFDDWMIPNIKDAETEKKVRELYEKAHGLDFVKQERGSLQQQVQTYKQQIKNEFQPLAEARDQIQHFSQPGKENIPAICQILGLNPQAVFKWAYEYASSDAQKRQELDQRAQMGIEQYGTQRHAMTAEEQALQQAADFKMREYDLITKYDTQVSSAMSDFEAKNGPGSFFELVRQTGLAAYHLHKQDLPMQECINHVVKLISGGLNNPALAQGQGQQGIPGTVAPQVQGQPNMVSTPQAPTPKPVIPGIQGKGTSPAKRVINSFDDARKRANELREAENG